VVRIVLMPVETSMRLPIDINGRVRVRVRELEQQREVVSVSVRDAHHDDLRGTGATRGGGARGRRCRCRCGAKWGRGARREVQRGVEAEGRVSGHGDGHGDGAVVVRMWVEDGERGQAGEDVLRGAGAALRVLPFNNGNINTQ
jgi:hypothetical protein